MPVSDQTILDNLRETLNKLSQRWISEYTEKERSATMAQMNDVQTMIEKYESRIAQQAGNGGFTVAQFRNPE